MKKIILFTVFIINFTFGQNLTKDELVSKLSEETCSCMSTQEIKKDNLDMILGLCMLKSVNKHEADVDKHFGKNIITNKPVLEKLGEEIGMKLALNCPSFLKLVMESDEDLFEVEDEETDLQINGVFKKTFITNFLTVEVVESSGKKHELIVLHDFDNAFLITDEVLKQNNKITVSYYELDIYDIKSKRFVTHKIISDIIKN